MSHISTVEILILDLDAFEAACVERGLELRRGQETYQTYGGALNACDHAVVDPNNEGAYEIGLIRASVNETTGKVEADAEGVGWMPGYDSWAGGRGMMKKVGDGCGGLVQGYGVLAAKSKAAKLGWSVREERLANGSVKLYCTPKKKVSQAVKRSW